MHVFTLLRSGSESSMLLTLVAVPENRSLSPCSEYRIDLSVATLALCILKLANLCREDNLL